MGRDLNEVREEINEWKEEGDIWGRLDAGNGNKCKGTKNVSGVFLKHQGGNMVIAA